MEAEADIWSLIEGPIKEEGLALFDIDAPGKGSVGVFRVYIARPGVIGGIDLEDCTRVSHRLLDLDEQRQFIPEGVMLEVSSPGINRRLRRTEHFEGAVGERVRVKVKTAEKGSKIVVGKVVSCRDGRLEIDTGKLTCDVSLAEVREARIDFIFSDD